MKLIYYIFFFLWIVQSGAISQTKVEEIKGLVTFISSQNVYVKFENTNGIVEKDTLYMRHGENLMPAVQVQFISSKSSAGIKISNTELKIGDEVFAFIIKEIKQETDEKTRVQVNEVFADNNEILPKESDKKTINYKKSGLSGRFSIQSHSSFSNNQRSIDYQRWRYAFSLNADRINGSNFSFSSYTNFNYRADDWGNISSDIWRSLKIYDLAVKYEPDGTSQFVFGRSRNRKISNVGSIDGLQFEKRFSSFFTGVVAGFRPDFKDLSPNSDLFEYGGYVGRSDTLNTGIIENNLAFMQQTNKFKTDRRFIYLQHSNNILENTYFFASSEIDLYKKIMGVESNEFILTSIFFSLRYSPLRFFSATLSYDARKNVVYYETYKNFIDSLFENETRQGLNLRTNLRLVNNLFLGLTGGYRFRNGDIKPTRNLGGYLSYSGIPLIESSVSVNYNKLFTNFVESSVAGIRISKTLFNNQAEFAISYRRSDYQLVNSSFNSSQNIVSIDVSSRLSRILSLTFSYEGVFEEKRTSGRIFAGVASRF